jgi:hypothetical protein
VCVGWWYFDGEVVVGLWTEDGSYFAFENLPLFSDIFSTVPIVGIG